jgi:hypothetical protein
MIDFGSGLGAGAGVEGSHPKANNDRPATTTNDKTRFIEFLHEFRVQQFGDR